MKEQFVRSLDAGDNSEDKRMFYLFFLKNDKNQSVEVKEVQSVDFVDVEKRLEVGESVFISHKSKQNLNQEEKEEVQ